MTLCSPADIRTGFFSRFFYCLVSKRPVDFSNIDNATTARSSSKALPPLLPSDCGVLTSCRYSAVVWVLLPKKKKNRNPKGRLSPLSWHYLNWCSIRFNPGKYYFWSFLFLLVIAHLHKLRVHQYAPGIYFFYLSISYCQVLDNSTMNVSMCFISVLGKDTSPYSLERAVWDMLSYRKTSYIVADSIILAKNDGLFVERLGRCAQKHCPVCLFWMQTASKDLLLRHFGSVRWALSSADLLKNHLFRHSVHC